MSYALWVLVYKVGIMGYRLQVPSSQRSKIGIFLSDQPPEFNPSQRIWISLSTTINNLNFPLHKDQQPEFSSSQQSTIWISLYPKINNLNLALPNDQKSESHSSQKSTIWISLLTKINNLNFTLHKYQQSESHSSQSSTIWISLLT